MKLALHLSGPGGVSETRILDEDQLVIGRAPDCGMILVDPERTLSNRHCLITRDGSSWTITDTSTNGVFLGRSDEPLGRGQSAVLAPGDVAQLGAYTLAFSMQPAAQAARDTEPADPFGESVGFVTPHPPMAVPTGLPLATVPLPFGRSAGPIADPAADPWLEQIDSGAFGPGMMPRGPGWDAPPDPASLSASGLLPGLGNAPDPFAGIPDSEFTSASEHLVAPSATIRMPPVTRVLPLDWDQPESAPVTPAPVAPPPVARVEPPVLEPTPIALVTEPPPVALLTEPTPVTPLAAHVARTAPRIEGQASYAAAPVRDIAPPIRPGPLTNDAPARIDPYRDPVARTPPERADADMLIQAFIEGARLSPDAIGDRDPMTVMRNAGAIIRGAIDGIRDLLSTRALVKSELRIEHTMIRPTDNNTLKFVPDPQSCVMAMLGDPPPGFMNGPSCMQQSVDDVKRHELAMVAALSGAVDDLLAQLDPERIRAEGDTDTGIGTMFPAARKARYWQIFERVYRDLRDHQDDPASRSVLGPMASAYARQISRVS